MVIFGANLEVGETRPDQAHTGGCIEWAEPLQLSVHGKNESLVAVVVSSRHSGGGSWCVVPGCQYESVPAEMGRSVWHSLPAHLSHGSTFRAEVETVLQEDSTEGVAEHVETFVKGDELSLIHI